MINLLAIATRIDEWFRPAAGCILCLTLPQLYSSVALSAEDTRFENTVLPVLKTHCIDCHGAGDVVEGDVNLATLQTESLSEKAELLQSMIEVLDSEQMPPEGETALDSTVRSEMIQTLTTALHAAVAQRKTFNQSPIRRMNRFQYNNAVVDLLELKLELFALPERMMREHSNYFDPASGKMPATVKVGSRPLGKSQLVQPRLAGVGPYPQDLRAEHGFDNRGDHLSLSPLLMESFLKLSRSIVDSGDFGPTTCGAWGWLFEPPDDEIAGDGKSARPIVEHRLGRLLTRAFRRTPSDDILHRYVDHVVARIDAGDSFTDAMKLAVSAVLASPRFLYLYDLGGADRAQPLDDFELASRLSFFLWGSLPDAELLDLAAKNRLSDADVLDKQITHMLSDRKLKRFCDSFPPQWLQLDHIISAKPDEEKFPTFYRGQYRVSMHMMIEPLLLFETVLVENRSIVDLIDPPFSYRSDLLKTWLLTGESGTFRPTVLSFNRVENGDRREGGVITNPAIMTMTSTPERSKPITRGSWMATVIFNSPPKPPPADVPPLPEASDSDTEKLTLRERLDLHRQRADCKGCHAKIDPLGFALENYGPTGMWRDKYDNGRDVDSSGVLFGKHPFSDPVELKDAIITERDRFTRAFAKHMLSFALGREVGVTDSPALDKIAKLTAADDYRIHTLIRRVILSEPFLQKYNPVDTSDR
ncbi:MAG: DUF1592 domain-containing protein [Pirellulaceae bacterium]|nr:DUF1592 domain-containing protein [Pirellulaceae bacterium]